MRKRVLVAPDAIFMCIFQFAINSLRKDHAQYRTVCKQWHRVCCRDLSVLRFVKLQLQKSTDHDCFIIAERFNNLHCLSLSCSHLTDKGVRALTAVTALSCLELQSRSTRTFTSDNLRILANLKKLEKLSLHGHFSSEIDLRLDFIHELICLRELRLRDLDITNTSLESLEGVTRLRTLSMMCPDADLITTDRVVRVLRPLTKLQHFDMYFEDDIDLSIDAAAVIQVLSKLRSLRILRMGAALIDDSSMQILCAACPGITLLDVTCEELSATGFRSYSMAACLPACRGPCAYVHS